MEALCTYLQKGVDLDGFANIAAVFSFILTFMPRAVPGLEKSLFV